MIFYPEERIALFIDGANLYSAARGLGFDIDYKRLLEVFGTKGRLIRAFYYTALVEDQEYSPIRPLVDWLDYNGYTMVTKPTKEFTDAMGRRRIKGNMDIELAIDMMEMAQHVDHACCSRATAISAGWSRRCSARACGSPWSRPSARRRRWSPTTCAARPTTSSSCRTWRRDHRATTTCATRCSGRGRTRRRGVSPALPDAASDDAD